MIWIREEWNHNLQSLKLLCVGGGCDCSEISWSSQAEWHLIMLIIVLMGGWEWYCAITHRLLGKLCVRWWLVISTRRQVNTIINSLVLKPGFLPFSLERPYHYTPKTPCFVIHVSLVKVVKTPLCKKQKAGKTNSFRGLITLHFA